MMTDPYGYGQTNPRPTNGAATPTQRPPVGHITPRMLLAVAAIYNPAILIGYLLYNYGPGNSCVLGGLCGFGAFPGIIQLFLLIVGAGALTAVAFVPLWWLLDEAREARDIASRIARDMVRFVTIRPLMVGYGFILAVLLIIGLLFHRIPSPLFLLGLSSMVLCFWCAAGREFTPPLPVTSQSRRPRVASGSVFPPDPPPVL